MKLLTSPKSKAILNLLSQKAKARQLNPENNGAKTPIQGVFYCLKKINTSLVRAIVMVARSGQLKGWPVSTRPLAVPLSGVENPLRVAAQKLSTFGGGLLKTMESPL
jgi:hypothetical protein